MRNSFAAAAAASGVLALALASCGGGGYTAKSGATRSDSAQSGTTKSGTGSSGAQRIEVATTALGKVLVDKDGRTLYAFSKDVKGKSLCEDGCAAVWPALGKASAGGGVDGSLVGTITRSDGSMQATYAGRPLYRYDGDKAAGDVTGQGVGAVWYVVDPAGNVVKKKAASTGGGYRGY